MRRHNILDVVRAVKVVAREFPEVDAWWYTPSELFHVRGEMGRARQAPRPVVMALEADARADDFERIAGRLSEELNGVPVQVRRHRGAEKSNRLFRVLSRASSEAGSSA